MVDDWINGFLDGRHDSTGPAVNSIGQVLRPGTGVLRAFKVGPS